ncbi:hypothetical protein L5F43_00545 [Aliarcobacter butzleri]|uniref:hypothetical protein n=1 Tax=Aliarcobacter butzleri TaxID=28197 RepID=UPI001EDBE7B1|nr:hypothetical protein [Aliarcobacter butzleri]MCG3704958.1 hypothetical protein [Aliarcobacter butzleri]MCT7571227.1 hypothetical protein [Aliarcobacter butzleri]
MAPSKIDLTIKVPIKGYYFNSSDKNENYGIFSPSIKDLEKISLLGLSEKFSMDWEKENVENVTYNLEIRIIDNCFSLEKEQISKILLVPPTYSIENIKKFNFSTNDGFIKLKIFRKSFNSENMVLTDDGKVFFGINNNKENNQFDLYRFITKGSEINYNSWIDESSYLFSFNTLNSEENNTTKYNLISKNLVINTGNKSLNIELNTNSNINLEKIKTCNLLYMEQDGIYNLNSISSIVIFTIKKTSNNSVLTSLNINNKTIIKGINGWIVANAVIENEIYKYFNKGKIRELNFNAPIHELFIDGKVYPFSSVSDEIYITETSLMGETTEKGFLRFIGESDAIYINNTRINLSRWEKLNIELKIFIFTLFMSLIIYLLKKIQTYLKKNT